MAKPCSTREEKRPATAPTHRSHFALSCHEAVCTPQPGQHPVLLLTFDRAVHDRSRPDRLETDRVALSRTSRYQTALVSIALPPSRPSPAHAFSPSSADTGGVSRVLAWPNGSAAFQAN